MGDKDKACLQCGKTKPLDAFAADKRRSDGKQSWCRSCRSKYNHDYYKKNRSWWYRWRANNRDKYIAAQTKYREKLRLEVVAAYGGKCSCCPEDHPDFLTLEHVNHDGKQHRSLMKGNYGTYRDLKRRGWPKKGYTILCWNCQMATRFGGVCPHKREATCKR